MKSNKNKTANKEQSRSRRRKNRESESENSLAKTETEIVKGAMSDIERAEIHQFMAEMKQAFRGSVDFYKSDWGGKKPHDEAIKEALQLFEWRREYVQNLEPKEIDWGQLAAVSEIDFDDACKLWARIQDAANNELASGHRAEEIVGIDREPYETAQFLAIRKSFIKQWQPNGGIEMALIDMMTIAFSLQLYWSKIAHQRALRTHNDQKKELNRYESKGWKSPYQYEANATDQAYKLADGYNRQFLRVLRQLRDLRRYTVVIQNNGGQVNVGNQQIVQQSNENSNSGNQN